MKSQINLVRNTMCRGISTKPAIHQQKSLAKFKKLQADYQAEDGRPIHLKGGLCDRILYSATITGSCIGVLMSLITIYDLAKPASWRNETR